MRMRKLGEIVKQIFEFTLMERDVVWKSCLVAAFHGLRSPVCWSEVGDSQLTGPEMIREMMEKIVQIKNCLVTARSSQKSYRLKDLSR
ncbi:hypothetical protein Tco_1094698 [Tanacetum coccineum]|uniref:Uncharacterized protein n=1 Tax=Tanacetum coccineum TaxID=301880 RepID=A0ABQ5IHE5_9ASTR